MVIDLQAGEVAILAVLNMAEGVLAEWSSPTAALIDTILRNISNVLPVIIQAFPNLLVLVQNVLNTLGTSGNLTPTQIATQASLNAQVDAALDAAAKADGLDLGAPSTPAATS